LGGHSIGYSKQKILYVHVSYSERVSDISLYSSKIVDKKEILRTVSNLSLYGPTVLLLDLGRFFSFLILYTVSRTPWTVRQPVARPLLTHRTQTEYTHTGIHALSGIRIHDLNVRAHEDSSCLRPRGHCDRPCF
jgi:hypothetical protein